MKIKQIKIEKLFGLEKNDFDIECYPNENITILYAFNGTGKTTLLKLIYAVCNLKNDVEEEAKVIIENTSFKKIELFFDNYDSISVEKENPRGKDYKYFFNGCVVEAEVLNERLKVLRVTQIFANKTVNRGASGIFPKELSSEESRDDGQRDYWELGFKPIFHVCKGIKDYVSQNKNLDKVTRFIDLINKEFGLEFKTLDVDKEQGLKARLTSEFDKSDESLSMFQLSSGEQNLITLFYELMFEAVTDTPEQQSIVLLDEPESSLHIDWQRNILKAVMGICEKKNMQVLVATHSPDVIDEYFGLQAPMISDRYKNELFDE